MKTLVALVGMQHRGTEELVASLPAGEPLVLIREPLNKYDRFAVQVWARERFVGFIKGSQAPPVANAMDAYAKARNLQDEVPQRWSWNAKLAIDGGRWPMVEIDDAAPASSNLNGEVG